MTMRRFPVSRGLPRSLGLLAVLPGALIVAGCLAYGPKQYSAMTAYELCELQHYQRVNLTPAGRAALDDELRRRNENCRSLLAQIQRDREDDWHDRMYNRQSP
jgi:hypothetical protein